MKVNQEIDAFSFSCLILFPLLFLCNSFGYRFEDVRFKFPFPKPSVTQLSNSYSTHLSK